MPTQIDNGQYRLTDKEKKQYHSNGYLIGLPRVFDNNEVENLNTGFRELCNLLEEGEDSKEIREWHESSRWLYDICTKPQILDYVEDILGANYYLWASNFFAKESGSDDTVGWHQDAFYWPLSPHHSVTVWIACTDSTEENGAMKVIPGSHQSGIIKHKRSDDTDSVLTLELEKGSFRDDAAVPLNLQAGEISLHDDRIIHGSPANPSARPRIGLTARYSGTDVKCDLSVNPYFKTYLMRGVDEYTHNPTGEIPTHKYGRIHREHKSIEEAEKDQWHESKA
ncbi:MAG: phytanoyl-CoA dioxygenase family protein [bacterium]|nr:phytanoyl-CoA dioxygenase family protein [bacterium]